jgi:A/G-specific adenine glycosylase
MMNFAPHLMAWQKTHGRHDLPWQNTRDPYAIWVSEIMLQQTQVAAVIPYYRRFITRFPDVARLASASEDEVLRYWSGLGYYSRARNLHRAAEAVMRDHGGQFPRNIETIQLLPGIGRSTAAAIAAFAFGYRCAILDGNVKRVLTRCFGIEGWPGQPAVEKQLWALAEALLPESGIETYSQGLMDLGATLCARSKPACSECPLQERCIAQCRGLVGELPTPRPRKALAERETVMLLLRIGNEILLEKRPPSGIWGGLWSLPEIGRYEDARQAARQRLGLETEVLPPMPAFTHTFTHFRLRITPQPLQVTRQLPESRQAAMVWLDRDDALGAALPAPVRKLLQQLD